MILASDLHVARTSDDDIRSFLAACLDPTGNPERVVVLAGDLVQHNRTAEFERAGELLAEMLDGGLTVILTPGNHDFGQWLGEKFGTSGRERFRGLLARVVGQGAVVAHRKYDSITAVGADLFVALRSTQRGQGRKLFLAGNNRITRSQIEWASGVLEQLPLAERRLHLVTHRSLWSDADDEHSRMCRKERLVGELLIPCGFQTFIHGHNHRFACRMEQTPKRDHRMLRIALPTLSDRSRGWETGWVSWRPGADAELVSPG